MNLKGAAYGASNEANFERRSSACRHTKGVTMATVTLLGEPRAADTEATWDMLRAKFSRDLPLGCGDGGRGAGGEWN